MRIIKLLIFITFFTSNIFGQTDGIRLKVERYDDGNDDNNIRVSMIVDYNPAGGFLFVGSSWSARFHYPKIDGLCPSPTTLVEGEFLNTPWTTLIQGEIGPDLCRASFGLNTDYQILEGSPDYPIQGEEYVLFTAKFIQQLDVSSLEFPLDGLGDGGTALEASPPTPGADLFRGYALIALPITLTRFDALWNKEGWVDLVWETESETNADGFVVERSLDGRKWEMIDKLSARGSVDSRADYRTKDLRPEAGYNYYRLKMVDLDGTFEYSPLRSVFSVVRDRGLSTYPNPVERELFISTDRLLEDVRVEIFTMNGESVYFERMDYLAQNANTSILLPQLVTGAYNVVISQKNGEVIFTDVLIKK